MQMKKISGNLHNAGGVILFVNHKPSQCGVYEFGKNVFNCIKDSKAFDFIYVEVDSFKDLLKEIRKSNPNIIIYNYMQKTMPWSFGKSKNLLMRIRRRSANRFYNIPIIQVGIIHSIEQFVADEATGRKRYVVAEDYNKLFDYYIAPDPTLLLKNPLVYKTGRPLFQYENNYPLPRTLTFGTAGIAKVNMDYVKFIQKVQKEYDDAIIKINIPKGTFANDVYDMIKKELDRAIYKAGIKLELSSEYFTTQELLDFLAKNTANFYLYNNGELKSREARGISSSLDNALSVKRPIILSKDSMYKHVLMEINNINIEDNSIHEIVEKGFEDFEEICDAWQPECLRWEYERIVSDILCKYKKSKMAVKDYIKIICGIVNYNIKNYRNQWINKTDLEDDMSVVENHFPTCENYTDAPFNRVLDDVSRAAYSDIIMYMKKLLPNNMKEKIEEANVQQAFVADTVLKLSKQFTEPHILSVGCYTDTAYLILKKLGIKVAGIDTVVNYDLKTFLSRPDQQRKMYDIIFSTSVIEHVEDDEEFVREISSKLKKNGYFIMTCDFKDGYVPGDKKPGCDFRLYTAYDLQERLLFAMSGCKLVGKSDWKGKEADFAYEEGVNYSFASFVVQKKE